MSIDRVVGLIDRRTIRNLSNDWQVRNYGACFLFGKKTGAFVYSRWLKLGQFGGWRRETRGQRKPVFGFW